MILSRDILNRIRGETVLRNGKTVVLNRKFLRIHPLFQTESKGNDLPPEVHDQCRDDLVDLILFHRDPLLS